MQYYVVKCDDCQHYVEGITTLTEALDIARDHFNHFGHGMQNVKWY